MPASALHNDILRYLVDHGFRPGDRLPTIHEISRALDMSVAKARESLEIARVLGAVEIKPGRGTRVEEYRFAPAATLSALYAISLDRAHFAHLRQVRNALEIQFWAEAVGLLTPEDIKTLRRLIEVARRKLDRTPIQVPVNEHRDFHIMVFARLDNVFVHGLLEAYWEAYEVFGLHLYRDLSYHQMVWDYHARIVEAIEMHDAELGRRLLVEHMHLLDSSADSQSETTPEAPEPRAAFE
jgi:DNA-binding FadR family transcriptional regulator